MTLRLIRHRHGCSLAILPLTTIPSPLTLPRMIIAQFPISSQLRPLHPHLLVRHVQNRNVSSIPRPTVDAGEPVKIHLTKQNVKSHVIPLNCLIHGDEFDKAFSVELEGAANIGALKRLIITEGPGRLKGFRAPDLELYHVSIKFDDNDKLKEFVPEGVRPLELVQKIYRVFASGSPPDESVNIIVKVPQSDENALQSLTEAFPLGLEYVPPRLLASPGSKWEYQPGSGLYETLRREIRAHYKHYRNGEIDKTCMPIYLFFSGAGTGKSRNAAEFHQSAVSCLDDEDKELKDKLRNAWVFYTSFENSTSLRPREYDSLSAISTRMLLQLLPNKSLDELIRSYTESDPVEVLGLIAKHEGRKLQDATVILVVDGLHADPQFHHTFRAIGDLMHDGVFLLPCCTSTVSGPLWGFRSVSARKRVYLPVASLEPPVIIENTVPYPVFRMDNLMLRMLVEDCGGHGRAIEVLSLLTKGINFDDCDVGKLVRDFRTRLIDVYGENVIDTEAAKAIVRGFFTHQRFLYNKPVPGTTKVPEQLVAPGLIRFIRQKNSPYGYFSVPYIWLLIMQVAIPVLPGGSIVDYNMSARHYHRDVFGKLPKYSHRS